MAKSKTPKAPKAPKAPKVKVKKEKTAPEVSVVSSESEEWQKAKAILDEKKQLREEMKIHGYEYNTHVKPLVEMYESGNRGDALLGRIHQLQTMELENK